MGDQILHPPLPHAETRIRVLHEDVTTDKFGWLRNRENPDVLQYLEAENRYSEQATAHLAEIKHQLVAEIKARRAGGGSHPILTVGPFEYFRMQEDGLPHSAWWRRPVAGGPDELVMDPNLIPGAAVFFTLGIFEPSDDGRYLAYSFDVVGDEGFELRVRDVSSGQEVWRGPARVGQAVWAADSQSLFFSQERSDRRQHDRIVRFDVEASKSEVVFEESNERLAVVVRRSHSGAWLFLNVVPGCDNTLRVQRGAAEVWCLASNSPKGKWRRIVARDLGHKIYAEHWNDRFLFRVDDNGPDWRMVSAPTDDPSPSQWKEFVPHRAGVTLEEVHVFDQDLVSLERENLRPRLVVYGRTGEVKSVIVPEASTCTLKVGVSAGGSYSVARHRFCSSQLIYSVSSFIRPDTFTEHDMENGRSKIVYQAEVPGYDASQYVATTIMADAEDGVQVPISLISRRDRWPGGPVLLNVYGCYGTTRWPSFFSAPSCLDERLSLLDRGIAFGIVHVRGGGEFGRRWYDAAIRDRKTVTYTDLIRCAETLVEQGYASRDGIIIEGKSAGGGTVLAAAALRPDLFRAVIAEVPVADIIDTELDFNMPFALAETAEYGDPRAPDEYSYMRTYDPYYNLDADRPLPPTYIDAALDDSQVLFHQPARYVAQRRSCTPNRDPALVFRTRMLGGHSGFSHGPAVVEEAAFRQAWILDRVNLADSLK
ncbi:S9 family peptidase [Rhizobium laguerreae]|uniref:prolyl oligopeptidase family serine peptidase n=1 Tax=Rhizobium laguerreae TaxID=1076926 RepID=UPI001C8FEC59|nr:prolyl oligopeptidase family serine peptidase [Rhizobium laguerreae]MBY3253121.1 S9 family peptidase [Rhizobium laguerreae]MBY3273823.1 S9 family peptidase [Rhizobium laguerreae]MBY3476208.1 S9 family peptidase [Rhizobium laguerreae]MBY3538113.1 S9 family peptidase [Rhizobium laguerreae]MBY3551781.1 S9 family peptidase [Rhizobium laguerreae]